MILRTSTLHLAFAERDATFSNQDS